MRHALQLQSVNQVVDGQMPAEIGLVPEDQQRDSLHGGLFEEYVELFFRHW